MHVTQCDQCEEIGHSGVFPWLEVLTDDYYYGLKNGAPGRMGRGQKHFCSAECLAKWAQERDELEREMYTKA